MDASVLVQQLLNLVIIGGTVETTARSIPLSEDRPLIIGRGSGSDIRVPEASVARRQCDLEMRDGKAWLLNYGLTRGNRFGDSVSVNGRLIVQTGHEKLTWYPLQCGDEIRVGTALFRLENSVGSETASAGPTST